MGISPGKENENGFSKEEIAQLEVLASLYMQAKSLILYSEEVDPDYRSNLQTIKELRDAFDHLMRIIVERFSDDKSALGDTSGTEYFQKNIQKSIGHVYRAAFDALDGAVMSLREKIISGLDEFPLEAVKDILPEYWDIRVKLEELNETIGDHRARKDIGGNIGETLDRFVKDVDILKSFHKKLLSAGPALEEYKERKNQEGKKEKRSQVQISVTSAIIGGIICAVVGVIATVAFNSYFQKTNTLDKQAPPQMSSPAAK